MGFSKGCNGGGRSAGECRGRVHSVSQVCTDLLWEGTWSCFRNSWHRARGGDSTGECGSRVHGASKVYRFAMAGDWQLPDKTLAELEEVNPQKCAVVGALLVS